MTALSPPALIHVHIVRDMLVFIHGPGYQVPVRLPIGDGDPKINLSSID